MQADNFEPFLEKHGLARIDPQEWYPLRNVLDLLKEMAEQPGTMYDFVSMGMAAVSTFVLPPDLKIESLEQFLTVLLPELNRSQYRGGEVGDSIAEKVGEKHFIIKDSSPFPDDILYGFYYGWARRLLPPGTQFTLKYDDKVRRRDQGGEMTVYHLTWE